MDYITKVKYLEGLLKRMKLPEHRKRVTGKKSIRWLYKNLKRENESHDNFRKAMKVVGDML